MRHHLQKLKTVTKWVLVVALIGGTAVWFYSWLAGVLPQLVEAWTAQPASSPILFVFLTAVGTVVFLPISLFSVVAGAVYGPGFGMLWSVLGILLGSTISFALSRYWNVYIQLWLERKQWHTVLKYKQKLGADNAARVFLLRMVHLFPYNVLNITYGLSRASWRSFVTGSLLAVVPWSFAYAFFGYTLVSPQGHNVILLVSLFALLMYVGYEAKQAQRIHRVIGLLRAWRTPMWAVTLVSTVIAVVVLACGSAALYLWRFPKVALPEDPPVDAIVVLGAGVANRAAYERALAGWHQLEDGEGNLLVLSGGSSEPGRISEAKYMSQVIARITYQDQPEIVLEEWSHNTWENFANTSKLVGRDKSVLVVTDSYHIPRAVVTARAAGFSEVYWYGVPDSYYQKDTLRLQYLREIPALLWYLPKFVF